MTLPASSAPLFIVSVVLSFLKTNAFSYVTSSNPTAICLHCTTGPCVKLATQKRQRNLYSTAAFSSASSQSPSTQSPDQLDETNSIPTSNDIFDATSTLVAYDTDQQQFTKVSPPSQVSQSPISPEGDPISTGLSALQHIQSLTPATRQLLQNAIRTLTLKAHYERSLDSSKGRIMLGICASNAPEALCGLKSWVSSLQLPRGMLHGMDVDGVPMEMDDVLALGSVYVKYSTGGAMTFSEMRKSGRGFDSLWKPGDALLEGYDGDYRGVYLNVELEDGVFRQFGVLPTDLFMEKEEW